VENRIFFYMKRKPSFVPAIIVGLAAVLLNLPGNPLGAPKSGNSTVHSKAKAVPGMVWIPGGKFLMGSPEGTGEPNEHPQHSVFVSGFYMDTTEVTQAAYIQVMGVNPSHFKNCPLCPVDSVSWDNADTYCKKVGKRLPTEAQWEYAARAATASDYFWGNRMNDAYAWHYGNSDIQTHPVAQKKPNAFGLYDMIGNVWEWCADWYGEDYYSKSASRNPRGPDSGTFHITRGGGFGYNREGYILRCTYRNVYPRAYSNVNIGFRCAR
jgi:formylglycine-generating enzyme required for sulfatase activity